jgi:hypothetical protein
MRTLGLVALLLVAAVGCKPANAAYPRMLKVEWSCKSKPLVVDLWIDITIYSRDNDALTIAGRRACWDLAAEPLRFELDSMIYLQSQLRNISDYSAHYDHFMKP